LSDTPLIHWEENTVAKQAKWQAENGISPPKRVLVVDDRLTADEAYRLASEGVGLLWRGDFQNARQLLQAMGRRVDRRKEKTVDNITERFHMHRLRQSQRTRTLSMLLIEMDVTHHAALKRMPDFSEACRSVYGEVSEPYVVSLRALLGLNGAWEWHKAGVEIPALNHARIYPDYGVFSPVRGEYLELVATAPLPADTLAFDIGTGTGVIAAILAQRGVQKIIATEQDPRAVACAKANVARLGYSSHVDVQNTDMFPDGQAPLIVCNPPWIPARPASPIEYAIYDPESRMLKRFLQGLKTHLSPDGEAWLILSDIAEHLGLRSREEILTAFAQAGLEVIARLDTRPKHPKSLNKTDPLHIARAAEVTSLWRLRLV
jgi:methylase of polypeptide subunit release factors